MGCGAGAKQPPAELDDAQKQKVCNIACKEMCIITASNAIKEGLGGKIVVDPPECIRQFDDNATKLRDGGDHIAKLLADAADTAGGAVQEAAKKASSGGGMMGKLAGMAAAAADKGAEVAAGGLGAGLKLACNKLADGMNEGVQKIREPFTKVGQEMVTAKETEITKVFIDYINGFDFGGAYNLIRAPDDHPEVKNNHTTGPQIISYKFTVAMAQPIAKILLPVVRTFIDEHAVTKYWQAAIEYTNKAIDEIRDMETKLPGDSNFFATYGPSPITLDLHTHIVTKVIEQMAKLFGAKEELVRKNPNGQSRKPRLFGRCFSDEVLNTDDLKDEHDPNVTYDK